MSIERILKFVEYKEAASEYSDESWHDYVPLCKLRCWNMSIQEIYQDARYSEGR